MKYKEAKNKANSFRMEKKFGKKGKKKGASQEAEGTPSSTSTARCGSGPTPPRNSDLVTNVISCDGRGGGSPKGESIKDIIRCDPPKLGGGSSPTGTASTQPQPAQAQPQFSAQAEYQKRFAASKAYADKAKNAISITMRESNPNPVDTTTDKTLNPSGFKGYQGFKLNV